MWITAQIIGFIGLAFAIISFQNNTRKGIIGFQILAGFAFSVHFLMLEAYTGSFLNMVVVVRNILYYFRNNEKAGGRGLIILFFIVSIIIGVFTWDGIYTVLPIAAMLLGTVSFGLKNPKHIRLLSFPCSPLWLVYNIITGSIAGVITELFIITSIIVGMLRFDRSIKP